MTTHSDRKRSLWYFLYILCCKNYPDENDNIEGIPNKKAVNIVTILKEAINRIFLQHKVPESFQKENVNVKRQVIPEKLKQKDFSIEIFIESQKEINGTKKSNGSKRIIADTESIDDDKLQFPVDESDDDSSSISDVKSEEFIEADLFNNYFDEQVITPAIDEDAHILNIKASNTEQDILPVLPQIENNNKDELSSHYSVVEVEPFKIMSEDHNLSTDVEISNKCHQYNEEIMVPYKEWDKPKSYTLDQSEDFWELVDPTLEEPLELTEDEVPISMEFDEGLFEKESEIISSDDKNVLSEKIKWLIPLQPEYVDKLITSAISHFFQAKQNTDFESIPECVMHASKSLPILYTDTTPIVTETEIGEALLDATKTRPNIDKRVIFHLVSEIFSEIYSQQRCLPQTSWVPLSSMVKKKNYTLWKGSRPPESYDLVSAIVCERIYKLLDQKFATTEDLTVKSTEKRSHLNVVKWCDKQHKENIDKILTNELRAEENEWVLYDEAEHEIKIQIADHIFSKLIDDAASWFKTIESENEE